MWDLMSVSHSNTPGILLLEVTQSAEFQTLIRA